MAANLLKRREIMYNSMHFDSPFNPAATAAIRAAFPNDWETIKAYGVAHPEIVPYVNANPLCVAIWTKYKQTGLVFQMDCDYECSANLWKDVRSAVEFVGKNVQIVDGIPYFGGNAYMASSNAVSHDPKTHTIEFVYQCNNPDILHVYIENFSSGGLAGGILDSNKIVTSCGTSGRTCWYISNIREFKTISARNDIAYVNKVQAMTDPNNHWQTNSQEKTYIGARYENFQMANGCKIYGIRIYDHLLTADEILANQAIDLIRWGDA